MIPIIQDIEDYCDGGYTIYKKEKHPSKKEMIYTYKEVRETLRKSVEIGNTLLNNIITEMIQNSKDIQKTFSEDCDYIDIDIQHHNIHLYNSSKDLHLYKPEIAEFLTLINHNKYPYSGLLFNISGSGNDIYYRRLLKRACNNLNIDIEKCMDLSTIYTILSNFTSISYDQWNWNLLIQEPTKISSISIFEKESKKDDKGVIDCWKVFPAPLIFTIDMPSDFERSILDKPVRITSRSELKDKKWKNEYKKLRKLVKKYDCLVTSNDNSIKKSDTRYKLSNKEFFWNGNIRNIFFDKDVISKYDLSNITLDKHDISGLDLSKNKEINIPFDKIEKRLVKTNLENYPMDSVILEHFDLTNTNLKGTNASIDLASCIISTPSKGSLGTILDENNTLYWGGEKLNKEMIKQLKLNIERVNKND